MKRLRRLLIFPLLFLSIPAFAHGNMDHILGTVVKIAGNLVTVEKDGKTTDVVLESSTTFQVGSVPGKRGDLKVGDRVVIHAVKKDGKEVAQQVKLAHPDKANH